jgi:hypothetical protein
MILTNLKAKSGAGFVSWSLYMQQAPSNGPSSKAVRNAGQAPDADDIFWRNVGLEGKARRLDTAMSVGGRVLSCVSSGQSYDMNRLAD